MDVRAGATPIGIPATPAALAAGEGAKTGSIALKWKAVRGAKSYLVRITDTIADNTSWKQAAVVTKAAANIEGLASGKQYWFQVSAVGAAGQGAWSDPAVKVAP
jgi:predicted phage tail protein